MVHFFILLSLFNNYSKIEMKGNLTKKKFLFLLTTIFVFALMLFPVSALENDFNQFVLDHAITDEQKSFILDEFAMNSLFDEAFNMLDEIQAVSFFDTDGETVKEVSIDLENGLTLTVAEKYKIDNPINPKSAEITYNYKLTNMGGMINNATLTAHFVVNEKFEVIDAFGSYSSALYTISTSSNYSATYGRVTFDCNFSAGGINFWSGTRTCRMDVIWDNLNDIWLFPHSWS